MAYLTTVIGKPTPCTSPQLQIFVWNSVKTSPMVLGCKATIAGIYQEVFTTINL